MNDPFFIGLDSKDPAKVVLGAAFKSYTVQLRDASVHYVSGGSGPSIIFLHGFSQDWYEFSKVMCLLTGTQLLQLTYGASESPKLHEPAMMQKHWPLIFTSWPASWP
jgi:hypothetical protein